MSFLRLVLAEGLKLARSPYPQRVFILFVVLGLLILVVAAAQADVHVRMPHGLTSVVEALTLMNILFVPSVFAWSVGSEQAGDTWKVILPRRARRTPFLLAKLVACTGWIVALHGVVALGWPPVLELVGRILGQPAAIPIAPGETGGHTALQAAAAQALMQVIVGLVLGSWAALAAVWARSSAIVVGALAAVGLNMVAASISGPHNAHWMFSGAAMHFANAVLGAPVEGLTDASVVNRPSVDALVLLAWIAAPWCAAMWVMERRDLQTGTA